ncbi:peptide chain release factor N(5)-glutamine methyltransferase [Paraglaciecola hydrolytica]|uniref:Release factor glutamine methyltransferase n=1 Tax=Paraglaciecola hydrolytica TaxID=1799789 RepID=A0A136A698_9ALTE|nr:peptide chain release factor N(5)-glutamine methyltransferase [Paraglaciecola hydrolytica]KXI30753.1 protein-(glutamine-N5) methyltransferase, release factor-specific [Paraglaciecola hydrolytica]
MSKADLSVGFDIAAQLRWAANEITDSAAQSDSAILDSKLLLAYCLNCEQSYLHTWPEKILTEGQIQQFHSLVAQRMAGHPIAHLVGYRDFWTLRLQVSNATLIPRPETELLVESALALALVPQAKVLDLGTGTGAIALSLAFEKPEWQITGIDKSHDAVTLARSNAVLNKLDAVSFRQSDWFSQLDAQLFDLIVSNPPYVEQHSPYLQQGDVRFEPLSALTSGDDGLDDIRFIIAQAKPYLNDGAYLILEHGYQQDVQVRSIFESNAYVEIQSIADFNGLPRISMAKFYQK